MITTLMKIKLENFQKGDIAKKTLNEIRIQIHYEEEFWEVESLGSLGHSLSNFQLSRLDNRLSYSKKILTVGQYLRKVASAQGIYNYSEKLFGNAHITKTYWSRLLNDKYDKHDKDKLIRIAFLLKLGLKETMNLLYKAGFTLSEENDKDMVITFCLEEGIYNLYDVDELLLENKLPTIFSKLPSSEK